MIYITNVRKRDSAYWIYHIIYNEVFFIFSSAYNKSKGDLCLKDQSKFYQKEEELFQAYSL